MNYLFLEQEKTSTFVKMNTNKKTIGFLFLGMACITWIVTPFIGFFNFTNTQLAIYLPLLIVCGEVTFLIAIGFLGKEYWLKVKAFFKIKWNDFKEKFNKIFSK